MRRRRKPLVSPRRSCAIGCGLVLFIPWRVGAEESGAEKNGFGAATGGVNLLCHPRARARAFSKFSGPARGGSTGSGRLGGAAAACGGREALRYRGSFATTSFPQLAMGDPACLLSQHFPLLTFSLDLLLS